MKKLSLKKVTIASLNQNKLRSIKGGLPTTIVPYPSELPATCGCESERPEDCTISVQTVYTCPPPNTYVPCSYPC